MPITTNECIYRVHQKVGGVIFQLLKGYFENISSNRSLVS